MPLPLIEILFSDDSLQAKRRTVNHQAGLNVAFSLTIKKRLPEVEEPFKRNCA
jgi:hypothetical protein